MFLELQVGNLVEPLSGRRWDRAEIQRQVACRVGRFQAHGLTPGDRVFLPFGNRLEFFAELLAIWQLGGCAIPVDARLTAFEVENLTRTAQPRLAVVDEATPAALIQALSGANVRVIETSAISAEES
ncbi:MAG: AMP-binding protein, partial [Chthoniobacterales bacterium]|nr:AMP-binding protein [Chthoniobacterales bacterium]